MADTCKTCPAASLLDNTCRFESPRAFAIPIGPGQVQAGFFPPLPDNGNGWCYKHPDRVKPVEIRTRESFAGKVGPF